MSESLVLARRWAIGIITTLLGVGMIASEVSRVRSLWPNVMVVSYVALFALTGILVWIWIWATDHELKIMWRWFDPDRYRPPHSFREAAMIAALGVVLSALFYASRDPLLYSIVFSIYSLATLLSTRYLERQIDTAFAKSRKRLQAESNLTPGDKRLPLYSNGISVVEHYFRRRKQRPRHALLVICGLLAVALAAICRREASLTFGVASYGVAFVAIVVSEVVIARWRNDRDDALRPIEEELDELERTVADTRENTAPQR